MEKNLFLALTTFSFAIGTAIASCLAVHPAHIFAKLTATGAFVCLQCNNTCDSAGPHICKISVNTNFGSKTVNGRTSDCTVSWWTTPNARVCGINVYDAQ